MWPNILGTIQHSFAIRNQIKKEYSLITIHDEKRSKPETSCGCLSCICSHVPGFRDRKEPQNLSNRSQKQQQQHNNRRKNSVESQGSVRSIASAGSQGPPHGTRVVLGRETSPGPDTCHVSGDTRQESAKPRLPAEIMDKFSGQSREVSVSCVPTRSHNEGLVT